MIGLYDAFSRLPLVPHQPSVTASTVISELVTPHRLFPARLKGMDPLLALATRRVRGKGVWSR